MTVSENPLKIKSLAKNPPPFQHTFRTPPKDLKNFVEAIVQAGRISGGSLYIQQEIFEPTNLIKCLDHYSIAADSRRSTLIANDPSEADALLRAVFGDWLDFVFIPEPKTFLIFADHDEYATFFAHSRSNLNRVTKTLLERGFTAVEYTRTSLGGR